MIKIPVNKNAQKEVYEMLEYLSSIEGKGILTGQHTQTRAQEELQVIFKETGKYPAICGFELLSYSPNINLDDATEECKIEVLENQNTLELAFDWANKGGIITFTWHWFSPVGGHDKSFYSKNTEFDAEKALQKGTAENIAFIHDLDYMASLLQPFCQKHIPIL